MNICENIILGARLFPEQDAILFEGRRLTYAALERLSGQALEVLRERDVQRGDRVAIIIPNVPAFPVWYYACLRLGAIAVSINPGLAASEMAFMLNDCGAKVVIGVEPSTKLLGGERLACVACTLTVSEDGLSYDGNPLSGRNSPGEGFFVEMEPDDPATILYTSGTTGFPKGATLSHRNVRATVHAFNHLCEMRPDDRLLLSVPLFHCFGQNALLNSGLNVGAALVLQRRFDPETSKRLIAEHQVTRFFGVPTAFRLLYDSCEPADLRSVRYYFSAAAPLPLQLGQRWREKFGRPIFEGYGLTETAPFASYNHHLHFVPGSIGTPVDLVEMKIVDPGTGRDCPLLTPGEIVIRGPNVMLGYWNRPEETARAVRDGWFHSGDIGQRDERGYFYILDRLKDMIVVAGLKVFPAEVERTLLDHPAVAEAAVVGFVDAVLGEKVIAFVVPKPGSVVAEQDLRSYCQTRMASYKVPARLLFKEKLPRNPAGKVIKTELRKVNLPETDLVQTESDSSGAPSLPFRTLLAGLPASELRRQLADRLRSQVARILGVDATSLANNYGFLDLGLDSVMSLKLRNDLVESLHLPLPSTITFDYPTIQAMTDYLADRLSTGLPSDGTIEPASPVPEAASAVHLDSTLAEIDQMSEEDVLNSLRAQSGRRERQTA